MTTVLHSEADVGAWVRENTALSEVEVWPLKVVSSARTFLVRAGGEKLFVKLGPRVAAEYANLQAVQPPQATEFGVPRVRFFDPARQGLALSFEEGRSFLSELVVMSNAVGRIVFDRRLGVDIRRVAQCMASVHAANRVGERDVTAEEVSTARARWSEIRRFFTQEEKRQVERVLGSLRLATASVYRCTHDFSARNILLSPSRVVIVDWEQMIVKPAYYTAAYLAANIEARARYPGYGIRYLRRLTSDLVAAYQAAAPAPFDLDEYRKFQLLYLIEYIHGYETKTGVFGPWKEDRPSMNRYLARVLRPAILEFT